MAVAGRDHSTCVQLCRTKHIIQISEKYLHYFVRAIYEGGEIISLVAQQK